MKFNELSLPTPLIENLEENNFFECTEVQKHTIPKILEEGSLMVQAQTGTGKTAAFLIPLIARIIEQPKAKTITGLIIAPTRELVSQIMEDAEILGCEALDIPGAVVSGGSSISRQEQQIRTARFIVATPGRLLDFCSRDNKLLANIDYFVLDESDRLFDMGFYPDIKKIIAFLPPAEKRISLLFSATLDRKVRNLANRDFHQAKEIDISHSDLAVDKIVQEKVFVLDKEKIKVLLGLLSRLEGHQSVVVFTNTKHIAESLSLKLTYNDIDCDYINGDLPQNKRQRVIQRFKEGKLSVLVATDVAARGLHVHNLDLVINYDIPDDPESYIHRIGRTGRAGKDGEAVTLVCDKYAYNLEAIEKLLGHKIQQMEAHYTELLVEDKSAGISTRELARKTKKVLRTDNSHSRSNQRSGSRKPQHNRNRSSDKNKKYNDKEYAPRRRESSSEERGDKEYTPRRRESSSEERRDNEYKPRRRKDSMSEGRRDSEYKPRRRKDSMSEGRRDSEYKPRRRKDSMSEERKDKEYTPRTKSNSDHYSSSSQHTGDKRNEPNKRRNSSSPHDKSNASRGPKKTNPTQNKTLDSITEKAIKKLDTPQGVTPDQQKNQNDKKGLLSALKIFKKKKKSSD